MNRPRITWLKPREILPSRASNEPHSRLPRNVGLSSRTDEDLCVISQEHGDVEYEVTCQFFKLKTSQSQTVGDSNVILNFVVKEEKHVDMYIFINIVGLVLLYTSCYTRCAFFKVYNKDCGISQTNDIERKVKFFLYLCTYYISV